ncbi:MAG TPA: BON domain-containing protein [Steroidobacteraceae bacterium]|nr:BON domain-containing protein [Steroidobacteraceae bacterium]
MHHPAIAALAGLFLAPAMPAGLVTPTDDPLPAAAAPRDPQLAAEQVKSALRDAPGVPQSVVVSTHADTVVLTGRVDNELQASRVMAVAGLAAAGVRVSSQLEVRPGGEAAQVTSRVREVEKALREDPRTAGLGISVSIDESQVIGLHGLVASADKRRIAEQVAGSVPGVKRVTSHLVVPGE